MEKIILVNPNLSYADEILKYKKEFLEEEPIINGSAGLDRFSTVEEWLNELEKFDLQTGPTILSYTKYFLENINSNKIIHVFHNCRNTKITHITCTTVIPCISNSRITISSLKHFSVIIHRTMNILCYIINIIL